jgi:hypothetical protein
MIYVFYSFVYIPLVVSECPEVVENLLSGYSRQRFFAELQSPLRSTLLPILQPGGSV